MVNLFMQVVNRNNRFGLKISIEDPVFIRSTHIFMKIIRRLGCDMQLLRRAWERVLNEEVQSCAKINISYDGESIDNSMHVISGWLDRLCYSDPRLYNSIMQKWGGII